MTDWTAESTLGLARGFIEARVLLTAAQLDIFSHLKEPKTLEDIIILLSLKERGAAILLNALAGLGFLEKKEEHYSCPAKYHEFLSKDSPLSIRPMLMHSASMWSRWSELTESVESGKKDTITGALYKGDELRT